MKVLLNRHIGDMVWLMYNDQVVCGTIKNILYRKFVSNVDHDVVITVERYTVGIKDHRYSGGLKEVSCEKDELFQDKESLIKSL